MRNLKIFLRNILIVIGKTIVVILVGILTFAILVVIGIRLLLWFYFQDNNIFYGYFGGF